MAPTTADAAVTVALPRAPSVVLETPAATIHVVRATDALPDGTEVVVPLPEGRLAYVPRAGGPEAPVDLAPDLFARGNDFRPLHDSPSTLAAQLCVASQRRVETGPQSERVFVYLRGRGLLFLENGETQHVGPGHATYVPAGEPARLWAQGAEDVLAVVIQPRADAAPRRTLAGEIARRRESV